MKARLLAGLALLPTALLLFFSPAVRLYVGNREDLHHQTSVLLPFAALALATLGIGALAWALSGASLFRHLTWAYLLVGPLVLAFRFLDSAELPPLVAVAAGWWVETSAGLGLWLVVWMAATVVVGRRVSPTSIAGWMAAFGVVLLAGDVFTLVSASEPATSGETSSLATTTAPPDLSSAPNVYHVVLDELQTDVLELVRDRELDEALGGFVYFDRNQTIYHATVMSLSSTFTSRRYLYDEPRGRFIERGFGERSFVRKLARAGYWTLALVPSSDPLEPDPHGFRDVLLHADNVERSATSNASAFQSLWVVANVPRVILDGLSSRGLLSERTIGELRLTRAGRALTDSAPVASAMSFRELVRREPELSESGRYTFVHLLIPHSPYVLRTDCDYSAWERAEDPRAQTACTLSLLGELLDAIEAEGRFRDAYIVVHGDHGAPFRIRGGEILPARARSARTPLLIKPPGRARDHPLVVCDSESSLLDVAPTTLDLIGLEGDPAFQGATLRGAIAACSGARP